MSDLDIHLISPQTTSTGEMVLWVHHSLGATKYIVKDPHNFLRKSSEAIAEKYPNDSGSFARGLS